MKLKYPDSYVVWDLETTGFDPKTCKIVEVAALKIVNGVVTESYSAILNHNIDIPAEASNIHGITKEKAAAEGIDPEVGISKLLDMIYEAPANVTHNGIRFDIPFLEETVSQLIESQTGRAPQGEMPNIRNMNIEVFAAIKNKTIDTAAMYKAQKLPLAQLWNETFYEWALRAMNVRAFGLKYSVSVCCDALGIDRSAITLHRAGGDVELTNEIYKKITA